MNSSYCNNIMGSVWTACNDTYYSNVEVTYVDYDYTFTTDGCRDVLVRVNTGLEESLLIDLYIDIRVNSVQLSRQTCPYLLSPVLTTTTTPDVTLVSPTSMLPTPHIYSIAMVGTYVGL